MADDAEVWMDEKKAPKRQGIEKRGAGTLPPEWEKLLLPYHGISDGHDHARRLLLNVDYTFLARTRANRNVVLKVLQDAKKRAFIEARKRQGTRDGRERQRERNAQAERARFALTELQDSLIGDEPIGLSEAIDSVLKRLQDPRFQPSLNAEIPRFGRGAPAEPWIEEAKAALKDAGVPSGIKGFRQRLQEERVNAWPHDFRDALLMAVGVTSYRSR